MPFLLVRTHVKAPLLPASVRPFLTDLHRQQVERDERESFERVPRRSGERHSYSRGGKSHLPQPRINGATLPGCQMEEGGITFA